MTISSPSLVIIPWLPARTNIVDADHMVITAYNITPGGEEAKAVEHDFVKQ